MLKKKKILVPNYVTLDKLIYLSASVSVKQW